MSATRCLQSLMNGEQCNAPAVNGTLFCRHHDPQREIEEERRLKARRSEPFVLPPFHTELGMLEAIAEVLNALADRRIKRSEADTFLHGLKFAARIIAKIEETRAVASPALFAPEAFAAEATADLIPRQSDDSIQSPQQLLEQLKATQTCPAPDEAKKFASSSTLRPGPGSPGRIPRPQIHPTTSTR